MPSDPVDPKGLAAEMRSAIHDISRQTLRSSLPGLPDGIRDGIARSIAMRAEAKFAALADPAPDRGEAMRDDMSVESAELAADLAKLDLILAKARREYDDDRLSLGDVAAIRRSAEQFGVFPRAAYLRAQGLGLLSYQTLASPNEEDGS